MTSRRPTGREPPRRPLAPRPPADEPGPLAYRVLIIDNDDNPGGFGPMTKREFRRDSDFDIHLASSWEQGRDMIQETLYDIFVVDVHLGGPVNGLDIAQKLRVHGFAQPIILVTNNERVLEKRIRDVEPMLRHGPTTFFQKSNTELSAGDVIRQAASRSDFFLRALRILQDHSIRQSSVVVGDRVVNAEELIAARTTSAFDHGEAAVIEQARSALRDGFAALMIRMLR